MNGERNQEHKKEKKHGRRKHTRTLWPSVHNECRKEKNLAKNAWMKMLEFRRIFKVSGVKQAKRK